MNIFTIMRPTQSIVVTIALLVLLSPLASEAQERAAERRAVTTPAQNADQGVRVEEKKQVRPFTIFNRAEKQKVEAAVEPSIRPILMQDASASDDAAKTTTVVDEANVKTEPVPIRATNVKRVTPVETRTPDIKAAAPLLRAQKVEDDDEEENDEKVNRAEILRKEQAERERLQNERRAEQEKKRLEQEQRRVEQEKDRAEKREHLKEERRAAVKAYFEKMFRRFDAALERLSALADRAESRAKKLEERGIDVSEARAKLAEARSKIAEAKTTLQTLRGRIPGLLEESGSSARELLGEIKKDIQNEAVEAVKIAHKALVDAIVALKANVKVETETEEEQE
ncbi:MAG: hypothetical protein HY457_02340 [Parcubacteria group bacterium]|nr:hypothetical protein [Parcubacteria group bacterium]